MPRHSERDAQGRFKKKTVQPVAVVKGVAGSRTRRKVHAGSYVHDEAYNEEQHDCGPWIETPASTRVSRFRYDYLNSALQVKWTNNTNHGYIYLEVPTEGYRAFARVASKGRHVNTTLNNYEYRLMTPEEESAPSNDKRRAVKANV